MEHNLIQGQHLADSLLQIMDPTATKISKENFSCSKTGPININQIPSEIQFKLGSIFTPGVIEGDKYKKLFNGDISMHSGDHSAADFDLACHLCERGLSMAESDLVFRASGLYRPKWDEMRGDCTYGERTIQKASQTQSKQNYPKSINQTIKAKDFNFLESINYRPFFEPNGMQARKFVGPMISEGIRLFPEKALSSIVALGAAGKTSVLLSIGCHVAAGKDWNGHPVRQQKVAMFFCEETQEEISRKFSAITEFWTNSERSKAISNLITIPLLGEDARLTEIDRNQYRSSGTTAKIIALLHQFELKNGLVILDHMQGFTAGDLNLSETATAICREANAIVDATGAAVVLAAHISKANIHAKEVEQGFAVGSLAFENATRQMSGMIPMSEEIARKFGLEATRKDYVRLALAKNSYGASDNGLWLRKVYTPNYHTIVIEPVDLITPVPASKLNEIQKISGSIYNYLLHNPFTTSNRIDMLSGKNGQFKASKDKIRTALKDLIEAGSVECSAISEQERKEHRIPKQVKNILRIKNAKADNF
jgi:AAA domain